MSTLLSEDLSRLWSLITQYIPTIIYVFFSTGAVTLRKYRSFTMATYFVNAELQCTGLESRITDCIQGSFVKAYSCLSFGIASVSCHGMFASIFFFNFKAIPPSIFGSWNYP